MPWFTTHWRTICFVKAFVITFSHTHTHKCVWEGGVWFSVSSTGKFFTSITSFNPHKRLRRQAIVSDPSHGHRNRVSQVKSDLESWKSNTKECSCHAKRVTQCKTRATVLANQKKQGSHRSPTIKCLSGRRNEQVSNRLPLSPVPTQRGTWR